MRPSGMARDFAPSLERPFLRVLAFGAVGARPGTLRWSCVVALAGLAGACGHSSSGVPCPQGMDEAQGLCVCSSADGCPAGEACVGGQCVCASDYCCPL